MKNNSPLLTSALLGPFLFLSFALQAQSFIDIPGPMGTVRTIVKHNDGTIYLGTSTKGVYRSVDGGQNWSGFGGNTIMVGRINDLIFHTNGDLLAATEQGGVKTWTGTSWVNVNTGLFTSCGTTIPIRSLAIDGFGYLYAGAHGYTACFPNGDLYRYDGNTWSSVASGLGNTNINSLASNPVTAEIYAGTDGGIFRYNGSSWSALNTGLGDSIVHKIEFAPNGDLFAGTNAGLAKLPANTTTWVNLSAGLNGYPVHSIAIDESPDHILVGTGYGIEQTGTLYGQLFETQNGGQSWIQVAPNLQSTLINDIAFTGNQSCLAVGWGIFHSTNNGQNWAASSSGFSGKTFNTQGRVAVSQSPGHNLFYGTDDGVFRSNDNGATWEIVNNGLTRHMVTLLHADHFGNLFCGVMRYLGEGSVGFGDGLLYKSSDNGENWIPVSISKDWRYLEISELGNGDLICSHGFGAQPPSATIVGSSLARSTDHGTTWTDLDVHAGLGYSCAANASGDLFTAGESQSVYRSTDAGSTFELIVAPGQSGNVGILEVAPTGDIIMGSGGTRTLYFSTDNGASYSTFNSPVLPDYRGVSDVTFDNFGKAYCSTTGQNGVPALFTISPPFTANSVFTSVSGLVSTLFKMTWDDCGYLYIYRAGGILKSSEPLRLPEAGCMSALVLPLGSPIVFSAFPNPTSDLLQIHSDYREEVQTSLFDLNGKKLNEISLSGDGSMSLGNLPNGFYLLRVATIDGEIGWQKILKMGFSLGF